ncbi:MAG: tetratricopeptide repeat protein [Bdellovibrionota bacterium]
MFSRSPVWSFALLGFTAGSCFSGDAFDLGATALAQPIQRQTDVSYFSGASRSGAFQSSAVLHTQPHETFSPSLNQEDKARRAFQLNEQGVELVFQGKRKEGQQKIQEALSYDPENPTCLYNLAGIELADSNTKKAIALMERAVALRPTDPAFLNRLAEAHFADSDLKGALKYYQQLVDLDPAYGDSMLRLGTLYGMLKDWDKAESTLRHATEIHPKDVRTLSNFGSVLVLREKFAEAILILEKAQGIKPLPENDVALGIAYEAVGDRSKALKSYETAKARGDKDAELTKHIAELANSVHPAVADSGPPPTPSLP